MVITWLEYLLMREETASPLSYREKKNAIEEEQVPVVTDTDEDR
jgi:hypothetical protein